MRTCTKWHLRLGAVIILIVALAPAVGFGSDPADRPVYAPNQVLVTLAPGKSEAALAGMISQYGLRIARRPLFSNTWVLEIPGTGTPVDSFLGQKDSILRANPGVSSLSRNYYIYLSDIPNDEFYPTIIDPLYPLFIRGQWQFRQNMHIFAPEAWDLEKGVQNVVVAVLDSGVRDRYGYNEEGKLVRIIHPDLEGRVLYGVDLADIADDPAWDPSPSENPRISPALATHGTHVAGIIAAQANNWIGVAGLCWDNVQILPIKVFKDTGVGDLATLVDGLYYAMWWRGGTTQTGKPIKVNVINMSLGHFFSNVTEESAVKQAVTGGIVVVAAAGNDWDYGAYAPSYPAAYPDSICVGATQYDDTITDFSQRGAAMDIAAPGWHVLSTVWYKALASVDSGASPPPPSSRVSTFGAGPWPLPNPMPTWPDIYGNTFASMSWSGTSMASPMVAAAAALLISHGVPAADVKQILYETATPKAIGHPNETYGWGLLNINKALQKASIDVQISSPGKGSVVRTSRPRFRINLRHAKLDTIRVWIDGVDTNGDGIPDTQPTMGGPSPEITNWQDYLYTLDEEAGKKYLQFEYTVKPELAGKSVV